MYADLDQPTNGLVSKMARCELGPNQPSIESGAVVQATDVDFDAIQAAVRAILKAVGEDPDRPGLRDTPRRVAKMYGEMFAGLRVNTGRHLRVTFPEDYDGCFSRRRLQTQYTDRAC